MATTIRNDEPSRRPLTALESPTRVPQPASPDLAPAPRTLLDIFAATVARCSDRQAIDSGEGSLSYGELADAAGQLGQQLRGLGVGPGDRVGVRVGSGTSELYVAILGVLFSGAAYVPVDRDDPDSRAQEIWQRSGASLVVEDGLSITYLRAPQGRRGAATPQDDAWVIFTSGSTGAPKGVAVSHRAAAAFVDAETYLWHVDIEDRVLAGLSVTFDASCEEIWTAWRNGAALVPAPRSLVRAGADLGAWIAERRVTVVSTVPTLAAIWDEAGLENVRLLILGGEACPESLAWRLASGREVWNTYGPTEATVVSTATRLEPGRPVTIGWPLRGWDVAVIDDHGEPVALGEAGELAIGGVGLARYIEPALDDERYAALPALGWARAYRTGDIVRETVQGLEFVGRRDDQVKIGGRRIELGEVDARLAAVPGVKTASAAIQTSASGNKLLVGYVVAEGDAAAIAAEVSTHLPGGLRPMVVVLDELPRGASGKVNRRALPWPPPDNSARGQSRELEGTAAWLAERWSEQLGPLPYTAQSNFFEMGGSSLAVAKLVSVVRERFPSVAVADVYNHRTLGELARRLDTLAEARTSEAGTAVREHCPRRWQALHLSAMFALLAFSAPAWLLGILALDQWYPGALGPTVGWAAIALGYVVLLSSPGRAIFVAVARRLLLRDLRPGRYPRRGSLGIRMWLVEHLSEMCRLESLAGTPWADRYARLAGHPVGEGARLGTLPPATSLSTIGAGATVEGEVDMHGWWIDGAELVIGEVRIGENARVAPRVLLMPGAEVGDGAEVETGTVVDGRIPAGERWGGSPARAVGRAGEAWPTEAPPIAPHRRFWRGMYLAGLVLQNLLPLISALPGITLMVILAPAQVTLVGCVREIALLSPVLAITFVLSDAIVTALAVRAVSPLVRPGWHADQGATAWALWFTETLMSASRGTLFPLYASVYTRSWLRLAGISVGRRAEVSTAAGLNHLTSFSATSFAADDVVLACGRARDGWLHVGRVEIGSRSFLGNGAILADDTRVGERSLVGVLTTPPREVRDGTSWLGMPAIELPRRPQCADEARTVNPSRRRILARGAMELVRIIFPGIVSVLIGSMVFWGLIAVGQRLGLAAMVLVTPLALLGAGGLAVLITAAVKWGLMGRYRSGEHPLWSFFVWRDEIVNTCQEQLAGVWLIGLALGTPLMSAYLRLMGAKVGHDVWCETMTITEFDLAELGDGCAVNRASVVETHLFHDRVMQVGPARIGAGATLGPSSAMLPETVVGDDCSVGGRSVVMRGEQLPPRTRWHGAPVVAK